MSKRPYIEVPDTERACQAGWPAIGASLRARAEQLGKRKVVVVVECYPGTYADTDMALLKPALAPDVVCRAEDLYQEERALRQRIGIGFAERPRAGAGLPSKVADYFEPGKLAAIQQSIASIKEGLILLYGTGASEICPADVLVYADLSRWELLQRLRRNDIGNMGVDRREAPFRSRYAWSYFIDWPLGDELRRRLLPSCDYVLEANNWQRPKLATGEAVRRGLALATRLPLRIAPFFDPSLWGDTAPDVEAEDGLSLNFQLDMEEDNLLFKLGEELFELPAINLLHLQPAAFLGERVLEAFGARLPFRLRLLDHYGHSRHRLQYYPEPAELRAGFGLNARQQDHYFVLRARGNAHLLAGFTEPPQAAELLPLLEADMPSAKQWEARLQPQPLSAFRHIVVPSGTVHSSGIGCELLHVYTAPNFLRQPLQKKDRFARAYLPMPADELAGMLAGTPQPLQVAEEGEGPLSDGMLRIELIWAAPELLLPDEQQVYALCVVAGKEVKIFATSSTVPPIRAAYGEVIVIPAGAGAIQLKARRGQRVGLLWVKV